MSRVSMRLDFTPDRSSREYTPAVMAIACPKCGAGPGWACTMPKGGVMYAPHDRRKAAAGEPRARRVRGRATA